MGSLYKRGNIWWLKYYKEGRLYRESSGTKLKHKASRLLKDREGDIVRGKLPGIEFERITFDDLANDLIRDYRINGRKTIKRARQSVNHLKVEFEGAKVAAITTDRINDYIDDRLSEGAANATINRELAALKRMLNLGARQTPPKVDRVPYIPMLKEENIKQGFFEHEAFETLKENLPAYIQGFVTFAYMTGWRVAEIIDLTWSQVDIDNRIVRLEPMTTKNSEGRTVYLNDTLLEIVQRQKQLGKRSLRLCPYVFPNAKGDGRIKDWRKSWNTACCKAKLGYGYKKDKHYVARWQEKFPSGPTMHDFRRTSVRNNVRAGVPESVAMKISGHKTRSVFDRYNIVNEADIKDGMCKAERYIRAQRGHNLGTIDDLATKKGVNR